MTGLSIKGVSSNIDHRRFDQFDPFREIDFAFYVSQNNSMATISTAMIWAVIIAARLR
jgi:hypothetical protein